MARKSDPESAVQDLQDERQKVALNDNPGPGKYDYIQDEFNEKRMQEKRIDSTDTAVMRSNYKAGPGKGYTGSPANSNRRIRP